MRRWIFGAGGAGAAAAALLLISFHRLASSGEEGFFANDCYGTLELKDGRLILNGKPSVGYTIGRDAGGPYILPRTYVGAFEDRGFEIDGTRPTLRLRFDRLPGPQYILLLGAAAGTCSTLPPAAARSLVKPRRRILRESSAPRPARARRRTRC